MSHPILVTAEEINCLIYSYFRDSGILPVFSMFLSTLPTFYYRVSAFSLRSVCRSATQAIAELLSKALLFLETEKHWKENFTCESGLSLLEPHICTTELKYNIKPTPPAPDRTEPSAPNGSTEETVVKRKASTPSSDERFEKRARTESHDTDVSGPECRFLDCGAILCDSHFLTASKGKPLQKKSPTDPSAITKTKPSPANKVSRPSMPADDETDPLAIRMLTGHTAEVWDTHSIIVIDLITS